MTRGYEMMAKQAQIELGVIEQALRGRRRSGRVIQSQPTRAAAVYVLFSDEHDTPSVTLIRRSATVSEHRGEYAFPGGGVEPFDRTFHDAALREVQEELGVSVSAIEPWGELDPEVTVTSSFLVVPFTGRIDDLAELNPSPAEVAEVVRVPVACLADPGSERTISRIVAVAGIPGVNAESAFAVKMSPAYAYEGRIIWGATARILGQVVSLVRAA